MNRNTVQSRTNRAAKKVVAGTKALSIAADQLDAASALQIAEGETLAQLANDTEVDAHATYNKALESAQEAYAAALRAASAAYVVVAEAASETRVIDLATARVLRSDAVQAFTAAEKSQVQADALRSAISVAA